MSFPKSVPTHLSATHPAFWTPVADNFDWALIKLGKAHSVSGSAFVDLTNPYGPMGNPFVVVIGDIVKSFDDKLCKEITKITRTPETIFIRDCKLISNSRFEVLLTVITPTGKELGACAHGFTGAIQTLLNWGKITLDSEVVISTTLNTSAKVFISPTGIISLEFEVQDSKKLFVSSQTLNEIFNTLVLEKDKELPILSVGSPKLVIEVSPDSFIEIQHKLGHLDYNKLLTFQNKEHINGIHIFCRNMHTYLPEKAIQVNAYLGKENVVDPATGVSAAAQISADLNVANNTEVTLTQYTANGPSAILKITKSVNTVQVGGTAVLFNYQTL